MSLGALIGLSLALGLAAWLAFLWSVRSGQYEDPEGPKYRMLEDDEGENGRGSAAAASAPERPDGNGSPSARNEPRER